MPDTVTPNLSLTKPAVGVADPVTDWGDKVNANFDKIDAVLPKTIYDTYAEFYAATLTEGYIYYVKETTTYYKWNKEPL